jgi:hypothetical protein
LGNQNLYSARNPAQIEQRIAFIDELRSVASDPAAIQALQRSRDLLTKQLPRTVAASSLGR